jgi:hypothetical protein
VTQELDPDRIASLVAIIGANGAADGRRSRNAR